MKFAGTFLTLAAASVCCASLRAENLLRPASPIVLRPALPAAQSVDAIASAIRNEPESATAAAAWRKRWAISLGPLAASQALDAASSYGLRELNPVLRSSNGGFGMKAASIKFSAIAGLMGAEYLLVRKYPRSAKFFTIVNWTTAGATTGLAVHNYRLPGR